MSNYKDAGVDIDAGHAAVRLMKAAVEATHGPRVLGGLGSFGGMYDASFLKDMEAPVLVASTDGVGTKVKVATRFKRFDGIGRDLVNHCVNDILVQGAEPLMFLDYFAASRLDPAVVAAVVTGAAEACKAAGCALIGGETAEMPGVYAEGELDLAGTIVGVVDRSKVITGARIEPGDAVLALPSSGLHTNGYSLARKVLEAEDWMQRRVDLDDSTLVADLLEPHRSYLGEFRALVAAGVDIQGLAHITGGGLIDNPPRVLPKGSAFELDGSSWLMPPVFRVIQRLGHVDTMEMRRVFNCGVGMLVVVPAAQAAQVRVTVPEAWVIGRIVERGEGDPVRFVEGG